MRGEVGSPRQGKFASLIQVSRENVCYVLKQKDAVGALIAVHDVLNTTTMQDSYH
jgi:hypothetical protein